MRKLKKVAGFSLIEVLIALAELMFGLEAVIALQVAAIKQLQQARSRTAATQIASALMEKLKTCPLDTSAAPSTALLFQDSADIVYRDNPEDNKALLYDRAIGDGYVTWHRFRPIRTDGTILSDTATYGLDYPFVAAYSVEWGPVVSTGTEPSLNPGSNDELIQAGYPKQLPGYLEVYIEVWVGWVEPGEQFLYSGGTPMKTAWDYYTYMNSTFTGTPSYPSIFPKHKVKLASIRRIKISGGYQ